eukprot:gene3890-2760_t
MSTIPRDAALSDAKKLPEMPSFRKGNYKIHWLAVAVLMFPLLSSLGAVLCGVPLQWNTFLVGVLMTVFNGMIGVTVGYHRLFSHRAFKASEPLQWLCAFAGAGAFEGSAKWWCRNHRIHHRYVDTDKDPYNAKRGFCFSHMGWMIMQQEYSLLGKVDVSDFRHHRVIQAQHKHYLKLAMLSGVILPTLICGFGWGDWLGGYFYAGLFKVAFVHHCTFFINSLAHTSLFGAVQQYSDRHTSHDSMVCALLTFGEGYHNYHHEFADDYRNGIRWYHYDPTKWFIRACSVLGFAWDLVRTPNDVIEMNMKRLQRKLAEERIREIESAALKPNPQPTWTWDDVQTEVNKGRKLVVIHDDVYDLDRGVPTGSGYTHGSKNMKWYECHPGGQRILDAFIGKDATAAFTGGVYEHHAAAESYLPHLRVYKNGLIVSCCCWLKSYLFVFRFFFFSIPVHCRGSGTHIYIYTFLAITIHIFDLFFNTYILTLSIVVSAFISFWLGLLCNLKDPIAAEFISFRSVSEWKVVDCPRAERMTENKCQKEQQQQQPPKKTQQNKISVEKYNSSPAEMWKLSTLHDKKERKKEIFLHCSYRMYMRNALSDALRRSTTRGGSVIAYTSSRSFGTAALGTTPVLRFVKNELEKQLSPELTELHAKAVAKGEKTYIDPKTGFTVMTRVAHLEKRECCGSYCRHCPYNHCNVAFKKSGGTDCKPETEKPSTPAAGDTPKPAHSAVYTKGGDKGTSALFTGERRPKTDAVFEALGATDELSSHVGLVRSFIKSDEKQTEKFQRLLGFLEGIQQELLNIGTVIATPAAGKDAESSQLIKLIETYKFPEKTAEMEKYIDEMDSQLKPLRVFILPGGGTMASAQLHVCRTTCRRAERRMIEVRELYGEQYTDHLRQATVFVNRLSDFFFIAGRFVAEEDIVRQYD